MGKIRKTYSKEYKLDVVKKYLYEGWTKLSRPIIFSPKSPV